MRSNYFRCLSTISLVAISACSNRSALGPRATLVLSTPPDFSARVSKVEYVSANGPVHIRSTTRARRLPTLACGAESVAYGQSAQWQFVDYEEAL